MTSGRALLASNLKFLMSSRPELATQQKLAAATSGRVGQTTIGRILRCETDAGVDTGWELAKWFNLSLGEMLNAHLTYDRVESCCSFPERKAKTNAVPLISWTAVGMMRGAANALAPENIDLWIDPPFQAGAGSFCLNLVGLGMAPDYRDGEIILIDPTIPAGHGSDILVSTADGRAMFRRLQIAETAEHYFLAVNPDFPDRIIKASDDYAICGVCTGSWVKR
ncbi:S24 family peptidase [Pseudomonas saliphila]|uniref:S24 family peptidase n=1 Tax=Pseudomonas saliphila TaxID=2586906 RepID=UPI0015B45741|nr:S24 family peptidase [Pseudomonas saliphila]